MTSSSSLLTKCPATCRRRRQATRCRSKSMVSQWQCRSRVHNRKRSPVTSCSWRSILRVTFAIVRRSVATWRRKLMEWDTILLPSKNHKPKYTCTFIALQVLSYCLIDDDCYAAGQVSPFDSCRYCNNTLTSNEWTWYTGEFGVITTSFRERNCFDVTMSLLGRYDVCRGRRGFLGGGGTRRTNPEDPHFCGSLTHYHHHHPHRHHLHAHQEEVTSRSMLCCDWSTVWMIPSLNFFFRAVLIAMAIFLLTTKKTSKREQKWRLLF